MPSIRPAVSICIAESDTRMEDFTPISPSVKHRRGLGRRWDSSGVLQLSGHARECTTVATPHVRPEWKRP